MNVTIELMNASSETMLPTQQDFKLWTEAALEEVMKQGNRRSTDNMELSIRLVDERESAFLNESFRQKKGPTNILSFPFPEMEDLDVNLLGDLAICAPLVRQEAEQQHKTNQAHWAHLTVHGVLHLSGYEHDRPEAAEIMESMEISILNSLGYGNPYRPDLSANE